MLKSYFFRTATLIGSSDTQHCKYSCGSI